MVLKKFITYHSNIITHHFITHHLSLKIPQAKVACLALVFNFDNSKNFTFGGTHRLTWCSFYFLFIYLFSFNPLIPKLTEPSEKKNLKKKKKKKKKRRIEKPSLDPTWKEKKKKIQTQKPNVKRKEKKKRRRRRRRPDQIWLLSNYGSLKYVCIYQNSIITLFL